MQGVSVTTSDPSLLRTAPNLQGTLVFNHRTLRLVVGTIAFMLPWVVIFLGQRIPTSISGSYYSSAHARDVFVGSLSVVGALLIAYNGHRPVVAPEKLGTFWKLFGGFLNQLSRLWNGRIDFRLKGREYEEDLVSTLGGIGALLTGLSPTACDDCASDVYSKIHFLGAAVLFTTVVYFCLVAFRRSVSAKLNIGGGIFSFLQYASHAAEVDRLKVLRGRIYVFCGWGISVFLLVFVAATIVLPGPAKTFRVAFWAELIALLLFGIAWATGSMHLLRDHNEAA
jgi:hypothetical protein